MIPPPGVITLPPDIDVDSEVPVMAPQPPVTTGAIPQPDKGKDPTGTERRYLPRNRKPVDRLDL